VPVSVARDSRDHQLELTDSTDHGLLRGIALSIHNLRVNCPSSVLRAQLGSNSKINSKCRRGPRYVDPENRRCFSANSLIHPFSLVSSP
jgi:hypothetical protein